MLKNWKNEANCVTNSSKVGLIQKVVINHDPLILTPLYIQDSHLILRLISQIAGGFFKNTLNYLFILWAKYL